MLSGRRNLMRYLAETIENKDPGSLSKDDVAGGLQGVIDRLSTLSTELTQSDQDLFGDLIDLLDVEVRDLTIVLEALGGEAGAGPNTAGDKLKNAVRRARYGG
jgi:hypothetical protein